MPAPPRKKQRQETPEELDAEAKTANRACDECRSRRVRCDKAIPCSNCKSRGSDCHTTIDKNREPRSRVNITKEYERKIDLMADRLASIEGLLRQQRPTPTSSAQGLTPSQSDGDVGASAKETSAHSDSTPISEADGKDSELCYATTGAHSAVASQAVEAAIRQDPKTLHNMELVAALNSLKDMTARVGDVPSSLEIPPHSWTTGQPGDPPSKAEIDMLVDRSKGSITLGFSAGLTVELLREKCESVFSSTAKPSIIRRLYVYGTLRNLCTEYSGRSEPVFAARCKSLGNFFSVQLGRAVNDLRLMIPASAEAASALTMAAGAAVDLCKPLVAHSLITKAASIVLSLGYHKWSTMQSDTEEERHGKLLTFWMVYWLDTSFAVRLGRAPVIQHYDISVPQIAPGSITPSSWVVPFNFSTRISELQCRVVEQLYTPLAARQTAEERYHRTSRLLVEVDQAWKGLRGETTSTQGDEDYHLLLRESDAVTYHSTICLLQYAIPSRKAFHELALESARQALFLNNNAWNQYKHFPIFIWAGHCHWTLLKGPIAPFTIIFCHIIAHPLETQHDLGLLDEFVATLKEFTLFSDGIIKMHRLCDVFCKVAALYTQAKRNELHQQTTALPMNDLSSTLPTTDWIGQPAVNDIDGYLSTIGFAPQNDFDPATMGPESFDNGYLLDWYQGQNSLMGFLEQDMLLNGDSTSGYMAGP